VEERKYWVEEEEKKCRLCGGKVESWEHLWEVCRRWKEGEESWQEAVFWVLGEEGRGEEWMREIENERIKLERGGIEAKGENEEES